MSPSSTPHHTSSLPPWHFPFGPSSRFHEREKVRPQHSRFKSAYTPTAPVLSTEARAHRRAHTNKKSISSISSTSSPSASEYSRSPLSRFSSSSSGKMPNYRYVNVVEQPTTPAKTSRRASSLQNSPFSDYFTDDARSIDSTVPSTETKQLLVRMNRLQSQLMRDQSETGREAIKMVGKTLDTLERDLAALYTQSRAPFGVDESVEDSAVFMDEEEPESKAALAPTTNVQVVSEPYMHGLNRGSVEEPPEPVTIQQYKAERDWFVLNMQDTLERLRHAHTELGQRYTEVREVNEYNIAQIEEHEAQLEQLRMENEGLRSDLGFEYSELLFLKLQMKSMEVDVDAMGEDMGISATSAAGSGRQSKKNRILSEMDRWRSDWQDVYGRFKRRRSKYGVSPDRRDSVSSAGTQDIPGSGEGVEWHLETVKEGLGRVTSLTIRRMDGSCESIPAEAKSADDLAGSEEFTPLQDSIATLSPSSQQPKDLDGQPQQTITQGPSEPQIANQKSHIYTYAEQGTQTDPLRLVLSQDEEKEEEQEEIYEDEDEETPNAADTTTIFPYNSSTPQSPLPNPADEPGLSDEEEEEEEEAEEDDNDSDCAITTSSSSEADDLDREYDSEDAIDVEEADEDEGTILGESVTSMKPPKTAWQELWDSLANLSGMGEEDED
ncbi:Hypothetical predicted protein [Lecanosticta acicola]|uniref:Uncharacterized protein n=1 Tax=Lecanosticta acicola TaxID=111012 RepID=A0AAI8YUU3_9PEZI|nr:Hypothetical predicted protein [Lecanosticta acicola]